MSDFTFEQALALSENDANAFVVNFDDAYKWLEYTQKGHAKTHFMNCGFTPGLDFELSQTRELRPQGGFSNREVIYLTVECFKMWAMMSGTDKGRQVRMYFIQAEKQLRQLHQQLSEQKLLAPWRECRKLTIDTHTAFANACIAKRHPGAKVHDLITKLITGHTASSARELPLVEGKIGVGLNHQPSPEQLALIAEAKALYTTYLKGSWKEQCYRAVFQVCPD